jgi:phosphopantothenoylcysteine decarboxylase/phosphopantothenate--cysteine ligase
VHVETAAEMLDAVKASLPVDIAVFTAAVADWRAVEPAASKIKKSRGRTHRLDLVENPDILATVAGMKRGRPRLVVGFAAETDDLLANARAKLAAKGADMIIANDVSAKSGVMGGARNQVHVVSAAGVESWPDLGKAEVAARLVEMLGAAISGEAR